jgi:nickel/cobalt transporter (NicO) family protein
VSRRRRGAILAFGAMGAMVAALALMPAAASAHPLGNFTTNQLVQVRFGEREAQLSYVLDQAEIPSFQQLQRYDDDGSGAIEAAERQPLLDDLLSEVRAGLELRAGGGEVKLGAPEAVELSFPPGQGGLGLTRLELGFRAPLPDGAGEVEVANDAFAERTGWRAIHVLPGEGTDVRSSVPATDPTDRLAAYPRDLLESPPDERVARFELAPGTGSVTAPEGLGGSEPTEERSGDGFADALAGGDTDGLLILLLLGAAFGWGALHALSPGHGKAMVAGYLAGTRGTPRHALALGLTITATHTAAVFALGLVVLSASELILPEQVYPWLGVASGLMVVAVGVAVMRSRIRRWRAHRSEGPRPAHAHADDHHHDHDHSHDHREPITARGLLALGISGGLVPCPSALVVLIAAISQHRVGLGMVLILAFSLGLAATVTAVGLAVIWGGRAIERLRPERRLFGGRLTGAIPALSSFLIIAAGVLIAARALPELG